MKLRPINYFITGLSLCLCFYGFSQIDTLDNHGEENTKYIIPESIEVDPSVITAPEGFQISDAFNGYIHYQTSSAIIVTLIDHVTYLQLAEGMNEEFYTKNQITYISENPFVADNGTKGIYYKFSFSLEGTDFIRYIVYAGDLNQTLWLNITYPLKVEALVEEELLKSFQTINLKPVHNEE